MNNILCAFCDQCSEQILSGIYITRCYICLSTYPITTNKIYLSNYGFKTIPSLSKYSNLYFLNLTNNSLTTLPELPPSLSQLVCNNNKLTSLPKLPDGLTLLDVRDNDISVMPVLPSFLTTLLISGNKIRVVENLPNTISRLNVSYNKIEYIRNLPIMLKQFNCSHNNELTHLPKLPEMLNKLQCQYCSLVRLPILPYGIGYVDVCDNPIYIMENLPNLCWREDDENYYDLIEFRYTPIYNNLFILNIPYNTGFGSSYLEQCRARLHKVNRVRELFYALKFKKRFRDWLWLRVRLPKIERVNHPDLLSKYRLPEYEEDDMEEVMENFGR